MPLLECLSVLPRCYIIKDNINNGLVISTFSLRFRDLKDSAKKTRTQSAIGTPTFPAALFIITKG